METLQRYGFWLFTGTLVVLLICTYLFAVRPADARAEEGVETLKKEKRSLENWWRQRNRMFNQAWVRSAKDRKKKLEAEQEECRKALSKLSIQAALQDAVAKGPVTFRDEYEEAVRAFVRKVEKSIPVVDAAAFHVRTFTGGELPDRNPASEMIPLTKELAIQKHITDVLIKSRAYRLGKIRFNRMDAPASGRLSHRVRRVKDLYNSYEVWLDILIPYERLHDLLKNILDSPCPFQVHQLAVRAAGLAPAPARAPEKAGAAAGGKPAEDKKSDTRAKLAQVTLRLFACDFQTAAPPPPPGPERK